MKAIWNGKVIAESDETIQLEGNHYFPPQAINKDFFKKSTTYSICPWKGTASYYNVFVDGKPNMDAAWFYPAPKDAADKIKAYIAFWRGVEVVE